MYHGKDDGDGRDDVHEDVGETISQPPVLHVPHLQPQFEGCLGGNVPHRVGGRPLPHHGVDGHDAEDAPVGEEGEVGDVGEASEHPALQRHQGEDDLQHRLGVVPQDKVERPA